MRMYPPTCLSTYRHSIMMWYCVFSRAPAGQAADTSCSPCRYWNITLICRSAGQKRTDIFFFGCFPTPPPHPRTCGISRGSAWNSAKIWLEVRTAGRFIFYARYLYDITIIYATLLCCFYCARGFIIFFFFHYCIVLNSTASDPWQKKNHIRR